MPNLCCKTLLPVYKGEEQENKRTEEGQNKEENDD